MNENLAQLKKLAQIFNTDKLISPEEIQQIFTGIVEILATYKKGTESINEDTRSVVNKLLEDVISIHKESLSAVEEKKKELGNDFADKLTELKQMVTSIQEEMDKEGEEPEDDTDDEEEKQALIEEIMAQITLPEVKATIVSGEEIVDKINELPLDDDNKIDWARIKNAPKIGKQTISGSPTVLANAVDLDGSTRQDTYAIVWDAARGRYTHAASGGGSGSGDVTGPASSTDNALARFDGTTGKIIQNSTATLDDAGILSTTSSIISGTNGSGHINLRHQASDASATGQSTAIFADSNGDFKYKNDGNFYTTLKTSTNTADRTYTYPDATGNLALKGTLAANQIAYATDTNTIASLDTTTYPSLTELSYVKGVTSAIQTQLNAKQATITGGATTITTSDLTASRALISNASGKVAVSAVSDTELGYVSGVTSSIQTQLDAKEPTITTLAVNKGGTGQTTYTNGQLLIGNTTGNTLTKATLTGTSNQVVVTNGGGSITLSTPQDIATTSNPQFATIELGAASDTTLSRSAAGQLAVEGVDVLTTSNTKTVTNKTLTTPTINGATITGDFQTDGLPDTDDTWTGKSTNSFNAAGTIAQFDCVYLTSSSTWALTDADAIGTAGNVLIMMAGAAGTNGNALRVIEPGSWVRNDAWNWTVGGVLYLDTATPGGMTQTAPSGEDDAVKIVGHAVTADVIYFNPSPNWIIYKA